MAICIIILVLGALCLTLFLVEKIRKYSVKATMIKGTTSMLFIALAAYCSFINHGHVFDVYVLIALTFGLLGDIWLGLKYSVPQESRSFTFAGFACFAIGHVLYIIGMMTSLDYLREWYAYVIPFAAGLLCGALILILEKPLGFKYGEYKFVCFLYGVLLFTTVFTTLFLAITHQFAEPMYVMLFVGGTLFAISDLILCGTYFGVGKERPVDLISNAVTYYAAQFIIAFSLFFII